MNCGIRWKSNNFDVMGALPFSSATQHPRVFSIRCLFVCLFVYLLYHTFGEHVLTDGFTFLLDGKSEDSSIRFSIFAKTRFSPDRCIFYVKGPSVWRCFCCCACQSVCSSSTLYYRQHSVLFSTLIGLRFQVSSLCKTFSKCAISKQNISVCDQISIYHKRKRIDEYASPNMH